MRRKNYDKTSDLNGDQSGDSASPSQPRSTEPATGAGFSFLVHYRDRMGTYSKYKPAELYEGKKWFVYYSYRNPTTNKFQRIKIYDNINRIKNIEARRRYGLELVAAINYSLSRGYNPLEEEKKRSWTLNQGVNYFKQNLYSRGLRKRSIQSYESVIRMIYQTFKPILHDEINEVTKGQVSALLREAHIKNKWSNTTYNNNLTFLKTIFNYLVDADILDKSPAKGIKPIPQNIVRHKYFDDETFKKIKDNAPPDLLRFILFLYHTGTRPNEARQLKYEHILRDRKLLMIPASISKNKKDDYVPLSDYILENFKGEGFIFGVSTNYFTQKFNKLKTRLKLDKNHTLYSIKHTRGIHLAQDGASPYSIMTLFRHSGLDITMTYLKDLGVTINREAADLAR